MSLQDRLRADRGGNPYTHIGSNPIIPPLLRTPICISDSRYRDRIFSLKAAAERKLKTFRVTPEIPEDDLRILEKIYHKEYEDCGRKRGALLRYIKHYRETAEPVNHSRRFIRHIEKLVRRSR